MLTISQAVCYISALLCILVKINDVFHNQTVAFLLSILTEALCLRCKPAVMGNSVTGSLHYWAA